MRRRRQDKKQKGSILVEFAVGATVIVTGLSPEIAQTLVTIGVDLSKMNTVGDLQGGIELAERVLGYKVVLVEEGTPRSR